MEILVVCMTDLLMFSSCIAVDYYMYISMARSVQSHSKKQLIPDGMLSCSQTDISDILPGLLVKNKTVMEDVVAGLSLELALRVSLR